MDKYEKAALKLVNKIRKLQGKAELKVLPNGDIGEVDSCPIATAIHGEADDEGLNFKIPVLGDVQIEPDDLIKEFISRFDDYKYPNLMSKRSKKEREQELADQKEWESKQ